MRSPFPGMDPYLEDPAFWPDFHSTFVNCWREAIADVLPANYEARLDEEVQLVEHFPPRVRAVEPDVAVTRKGKVQGRRDAGSATATLEPVTIPHVLPKQRRRGYIKILHRPDRSLVAVLEMLSPTNKRGADFQAYLNKRQAVLRQDAHLIELDLLLRGRRLPLSDPLPPGDYYYLVSRFDEWPDCAVYSWTLRQPLPVVPVPLRSPDRDVLVDLGAVFATAYERGRYGRSLDYKAAPPVPVDKATLARVRRRRRT